MVYVEFGGQTECIMGNSKIENSSDTVEYDMKNYGDRGECSAEADTTQQWRGGGGGGVVGENPGSALGIRQC